MLDELDFIAKYDKAGRLEALAEQAAWVELVGELSPSQELPKRVVTWMTEHVRVWLPEQPTHENVAKQMAAELVGHPVILYAGPRLVAVSEAWKRDLNERAQHLAFCDQWSESGARELSGWRHPDRHGLKVVQLRSGLDSRDTQDRFELVNRKLSNRFAPIQVWAEGDTQISQVVWTRLLGAFVAGYLAVLNQVGLTDSSEGPAETTRP